jgi:Dolichyl-phosphate-mannose-protein mannosyltransferase
VTANQALGAIALLLAVICFALAYRAARAECPRVALGWILAGGVVLRVYAGLDPYLHLYDERYHALVTRNLIAHPLTPTLYDDPALPYDAKSWLDNHVWLHKPPLALWLMAASMAVLGVNEAALRLPSLVLSTAGIGLTYALGTRLFDWRVGLLAAFFHAIHGLLVELASGGMAADHVDTALFFFVELGVYLGLCHARSPRALYLPLIGAATGAALLAKWLAGLVVLPVWLAFRWGGTRLAALLAEASVIVLVCAAVFVPWQLYIHARFPTEAAHESRYSFEHLTEVKEGRGGGALYHFRNMPRVFGELVPIPMLWFLYRVFARREPPGVLALAVWVAVPYAVFTAAATKMVGYVLIAAPAVFIIQAHFWESCRRAPIRRGWRGSILVLLALLVVLPVRQSVDRLKPFNVGDIGSVRSAQELRDLASRLPSGRVVVFVVGRYDDGIPRHVEAMFYTGRPTYSRTPTRDEVDQLAREGRTVVIYQRDDSDLPAYLRANAAVRVLRPRLGRR